MASGGPTMTADAPATPDRATEQWRIDVERQKAASLESLAASAASIRRNVTVSMWAFLWGPLIGVAAVAAVRATGALRGRRRH